MWLLRLHPGTKPSPLRSALCEIDRVSKRQWAISGTVVSWRVFLLHCDMQHVPPDVRFAIPRFASDLPSSVSEVSETCR